MDAWCILDFSAVVNHCLNSGNDPEFEYDELSGRKVNSAEHGFSVFIEEYINPILADFRPDQIIACHDGGIDYRKYIFPDYKNKRIQKKQEESAGLYNQQLEACKRLCKNFLAAMGITQGHVKGVEGDDLIAYLRAGLRGMVRIYTVDADMLVLCDENTQLFMKNKWVNPACLDIETAPNMAKELHAQLGADFPRYITLYKSLVGDSSDEYIGVHGFGWTKFSDMYCEIGNDGLDELAEAVENKSYQALKEAAEQYEKVPKWLSLILDNTSQWRTSWVLAQLHPELCEKPWQRKITKIDWVKRVPNEARLRNVLREAKASDLYPQFQEYLPDYWLIDANNYDESDIAEFTELCKISPCVSFDYEGYDDQYENFIEAANGRGHVDVSHSRPTGVSFCLGDKLQHCFYITVEHKDSANLPTEVIRKFLEAIPDECVIVAQNAAYEMTVTKQQLGLELEGLHDTMIMANYVDENDFSNLKHLSKKWLNYKQSTYAETIAKAGVPNATMKDLTADEVLKYGIDDSVVTAHIWTLLRIIMMCEHTWDFYEREEPLATNVLVDAYAKGTVIDWEVLAELKKDDEKTAAIGMISLRQLLDENCGSLNEKFLDQFMNAEKGNWSKETRHKLALLPDDAFAGRDKALAIADGISNAVTAKRERFTELGEYKPYREELVYPEFKPTPKALSKVCEKLGLPKIESISKRKLADWAMSTGAFNFDPMGDEVLEPDQVYFISLLNEAAGELKQRAGEKYDKLIKFCIKYADLQPKTIKHGSELNTGSPQQVQAILYVMLGFPVRLRSKTQAGSLRATLRIDGSPATDAIAVDTALAEDCAEGDWRRDALLCVKAIKEAETRLGLYHKPYPLWQHPDTDLIYPSIKNFGTVTGRPSGSSPNILQVSKHQLDGAMRGIFLPRQEDHCIVAIDFAGQELRILASVTRDKNLLSAYIGEANANTVISEYKKSRQVWSFSADEVLKMDDLRDIHSMTASGMTHVFGIPRMSYDDYIQAFNDKENEYHETATKIRKRPAKQTNFLLAYGGSAPSLATRLIIAQKEASQMMDSTHALYKGIAIWQASSARFARDNGYTVTAYGKRRHVTNDIFNKDGGKRARMERQANNAEIQGAAADILKVVLAESWRQQVWKITGAVMVAPVYDEIVASVPISQVIRYIRMMVPIMNVTPPEQPVPMLADISIGHNWQAQIELGMDPTDDAINKVLDEVAPKVAAKWATLKGKFKEAS